MLAKECRILQNLSDSERDRIWQEAKNLKATEGQKAKEAYDRMSASDKARFDAIMQKLKNRNISGEERERYLSELAEIARKYETA